jgi:hypothetical protein
MSIPCSACVELNTNRFGPWRNTLPNTHLHQHRAQHTLIPFPRLTIFLMVAIRDKVQLPENRMIRSIPIREFRNKRARIRMKWMEEDAITVDDNTLVVKSVKTL